MSKATEHGPYTYNYDSLNRLAGAFSPVVPQENYTYDPVGNRLTSASANSWTYNQNNELQSYNGVSFQYDLNGNTTQRNDNGTIQNFLYNEDDRLTEVKDGSGAVVATYYYDPFGRRLWKEVGGARTYFMYADEGLVAELDGTGSETKSYGYAPNSTWTTNPLFMKEGSQYYFYHNDHLGTPQKMTAVNGSTVWSAKHESFGKVEVDPASTVENNLRFPGQYYDQETGLHYNYHRYYDPVTGRYNEPDLVKAYAHVNLYTYSLSRPLRWIDPFGLESFADFRYRNISKCIDRFGSEMASCDVLCDAVKKNLCELQAKLHFEGCLQRFWESVDINGDGKVDGWDDWWWFIGRFIPNLIKKNAPFMPNPPGFGDEGPGSSDPTWQPPADET